MRRLPNGPRAAQERGSITFVEIFLDCLLPQKFFNLKSHIRFIHSIEQCGADYLSENEKLEKCSKSIEIVLVNYLKSRQVSVHSRDNKKKTTHLGKLTFATNLQPVLQRPLQVKFSNFLRDYKLNFPNYQYGQKLVKEGILATVIQFQIGQKSLLSSTSYGSASPTPTNI